MEASISPLVTSLIAVASALAGVALKSVVDVVTERRRHAREDRLRFVDERKTAYAALLLACQDARERTDEARLEDAKKVYSEVLLLVNPEMRKVSLELMLAAKSGTGWGDAREEFIQAAQRDLGTYSD